MQAKKGPQERRFTRPVHPDQARYLSRGHGEAHIVQDFTSAQPHRKAVDSKGRALCHGGRGGRFGSQVEPGTQCHQRRTADEPLTTAFCRAVTSANIQVW